jgi:CDP-4-dehydro-6-deoxyglucose reductase
MTTISYSADGAMPRRCTLRENETVLEGLERHGIAVPNSCRSGVCQSCLMQAAEGATPAAAQKGLKDSLKARGYFLSCVCTPAEDMTIHPAAHAVQRARAMVRGVEMLSRDVARVMLSYESPFDYFPGQFVNVVRQDGLMRSYSLANLKPASSGLEDLLELHVRKIANGRMSNWLHEVQAGEEIDIQGPQGDCFYVPGRPDQPMLLAGAGTGLAPLYAIARDALRHGHTGEIRLYHGAREAGGLYLVDELNRLAADHENFTYIPCLMNGVATPAMRVGEIDKIILGDVPKFAGWRAFLCGNPELVNMLRKKVFLAGASMKEIYSDAFVMREMVR